MALSWTHSMPLFDGGISINNDSDCWPRANIPADRVAKNCRRLKFWEQKAAPARRSLTVAVLLLRRMLCLERALESGLHFLRMKIQLRQSGAVEHFSIDADYHRAAGPSGVRFFDRAIHAVH